MTSEQRSELIGNVYAIPGDRKFAFAKVVYVSEYFADVILVRFFEKAFTSAELDVAALGSVTDRPVYTAITSIDKGNWIFCIKMAVTELERAMSRRIVGGEVWIEDQYLGRPSTEEATTLPQMDIFGYRLLEKAVTRLELQ